MTEPTDAELTECYKAANGEDVGKAQPLTTQRIFRAMRAAIAKWGTPAGAGDAASLVQAAQAFVLDPTSLQKKLTLEAQAWGPLASAPQPAKAQAGAVPLTDGQAKEVLWAEHLRWMRAAGLDTEGMRPTGEWLDHWLTYVRAIERAHGIGIKGGQHG